MKKAILFVCASFLTGITFATDLIVQEAGPVGTYASINAAVAASTDGDRIIINNKTGGFPWNEDVLINKTLTFLSAVDNDRFIVEGEYTIQHAPGREVTIIGMRNIDGDIASIANGGTSRTIVNTMWCELVSGNIDVDHNYFELNASGCDLSGTISCVYGKVIGNDLNGSINISTDALVGDDSVHVVGNSTFTINSGTTAHYVYISNNYVFLNSTFGDAIDLVDCKDGVGTNVVRNNSVRTGDNGIVIAAACSGKIIIYNNIIYDGGTADFGISNQATVNLIVSFNFFDNSFDNGNFSGFVNDGTNVVSASVVLNSDGSSAWTGTTDGGSPSLADYDLDLTRNDPGCFGGSYSHANFFPIDGTSSRVYYLQMPTEILVGGSNSVTGHSYDR